LTIFGVTWAAQGIVFTRNYGEWDTYWNMRAFVIFDAVGIAADNINFAIIALIIYKSSNVRASNSGDVSLLSYLQA